MEKITDPQAATVSHALQESEADMSHKERRGTLEQRRALRRDEALVVWGSWRHHINF